MYEIDVSIGRDKVHKNYICFIPLFCVGSFKQSSTKRLGAKMDDLKHLPHKAFLL